MSIPICMCGKQPILAKPFAEYMLPEFDVVFHFQSRTAFNEDFPLLLAGTPIPNPKTDIGSNLTRARQSQPARIPLAIFLGADFTDEEAEAMMPSYPDIPWLAQDHDRRSESKRVLDANPEGMPMMQLVAERAKDCLREYGLVEGREGDVRAGLWRY